MTLHRSNKMTLWLLAVAFTILAGAILATSAMTAPAEAQDPAGSIDNLLVSSPNPGQLLITWGSPAEVPTDYRVRWAPSNQDYLSYSAPNEANRGSEYPNGQDTSMTLTDLTEGQPSRSRSARATKPAVTTLTGLGVVHGPTSSRNGSMTTHQQHQPASTPPRWPTTA